MTDIAPIKGLIELTDNFTSDLGLAEAALNQFTKTNQESLKATATAFGLVIGAVTAVGAAVLEMGKHGSEVDEVESSVVRFAGSAQAAAADMDALRKSTLNTIDNFTLAKDAALLLSTGVKLTASDFGTLGAAAIEMQARGLGPAKDNLEVLSDALVTGRTRTLAFKLGVVDIADAQEDFAKSIDTVKGNLNQVGLAEANRVAVLKLMQSASLSATSQERNFAQNLDAGKSSIVNWTDELDKSVAKSPVFAAGFKGISNAVSDAFGGDQNQAIKTFTGYIEDGALKVIGFAETVLPLGKVFEVAFLLVKTSVLAATTVIVGLATGVAYAMELAADGAEKLGIISTGTAQVFKDTRQQLTGMTEDLLKQTNAAHDAITQHTDFDETLDKLGAGLEKTRQGMLAAKDAAEVQTQGIEKASAATQTAAKSQQELTQGFIDQDKAAKDLAKSTAELADIWKQYYSQVAAHSKDSGDAQRAEVEATFQKNVDSLDKQDKLYKEKYAAYAAIAKDSLEQIVKEEEKNALALTDLWAGYYDQVAKHSQTAGQSQRTDIEATFRANVDALDKSSKDYAEKYAAYRAIADDSLKHIGSSWDSLAAQSKEAVQEQADAALKNYQQMLDSGLQFSRDVLDAQRQKWMDLADQVRNYGLATKTAVAAATETMDQFIKRIGAAQDALKNLTSAGSYDVSKSNFTKTINDIITDYGYNPSGIGSNIDVNVASQLASKGYSLQEILEFFRSHTLPATPVGPRIPGFADGGLVMVGERGPEAVRLPYGSQVFPNGASPGGQTVNIHPGAVVMQYPIMTSPRAINEVGNMLGDVMLARMRAKGYRVG